jgi:hypothetical protein
LDRRLEDLVALSLELRTNPYHDVEPH